MVSGRLSPAASESEVLATHVRKILPTGKTAVFDRPKPGVRLLRWSARRCDRRIGLRRSVPQRIPGPDRRSRTWKDDCSGSDDAPHGKVERTDQPDPEPHSDGTRVHGNGAAELRLQGYSIQQSAAPENLPGLSDPFRRGRKGDRTGHRRSP